MAKNRKNESAVIRFGPVLKAFGLIALIGSASVGYVWQKGQIDQLGKQIKEREIRLAELRDQNKKLRDNLAMMRSPAMIQKRLSDMKISMVMPPAKDVWSVAEPVARPVSAVSAAVVGGNVPVRQMASR